MPSKFSSLGMPIHSEQDYEALFRKIVGKMRTLDVAGGQYLHYAAPSGIELWLYTNQRFEIVSFNPHYAGSSRVPVALVNTIRRDDHDAHDVGLHAWANPPEDNLESGDYPLIFAVPNLELFGSIATPMRATAQITAFAQELTVYDSEEAFSAAGATEMPLASRSFIPIGMFPVSPGEGSPMQAMALFAGHVLQVERKTNELTGLPFDWMLVESLGGVYDVVADPEVVTVEPKVGNVIMGTFWLSGYPINLPYHTPVKRKIWERLGWGKKPN